MQTIINTVQERYPYFDAGMDTIIKNQALLKAQETRVSPPLQYIQSLKWDKKKRLDTWIHHVYGVPNNSYYSYIGKHWMNAIARRLAYPASQFDHVLVMEGRQGFGKSTILRTLCTFEDKKYFAETTEAPDNGKEFALSLNGNIVVEFGEGSITGHKDQKKVKSFITKTEDNYRPPYMKNTEKHPRQCVFAMTTNEIEYLQDKTGERRYWIIDIPRSVKLGDWDWVSENREQLFAEAYTHIDDKYEFMPEDVLEYWTDLVVRRKEVDPIEDVIIEWFAHLPKTTRELGVGVIEAKEYIKTKDMSEFKNQYLDKHISSIFTGVLKLEQRRTRVDGVQKRMYFPTSHTPQQEDLSDEF